MLAQQSHPSCSGVSSLLPVAQCAHPVHSVCLNVGHVLQQIHFITFSDVAGTFITSLRCNKVGKKTRKLQKKRFLHNLGRKKATINGDERALNIACKITRKKENDFRHLIRFSPSPHRKALLKIIPGLDEIELDVEDGVFH